MDDCIKRSDALKVIETANSMTSGLLEAMMKLCVTMDRIAAADVVPVRHGRWIVDDITGLVKCAECDNDAPLDTTGGGQWCSPFCPSCGAIMDGDGE